VDAPPFAELVSRSRRRTRNRFCGWENGSCSLLLAPSRPFRLAWLSLWAGAVVFIQIWSTEFLEGSFGMVPSGRGILADPVLGSRPVFETGGQAGFLMSLDAARAANSDAREQGALGVADHLADDDRCSARSPWRVRRSEIPVVELDLGPGVAGQRRGRRRFRRG